MRRGWTAAGDAAALIYFVCCGVSRLARFNVTAEALAAGSDSGKVAYFEGTPIPTSVVLTAVLAFAAWRDRIGENLYICHKAACVRASQRQAHAIVHETHRFTAPPVSEPQASPSTAS